MAMNGSLHIVTGWKNNRSFLKTAYCTPPFKVANVTQGLSCESLQLMLMSSSPGILDGDRYHLCIELEEASSLELQTQSYQRLFQMKDAASQYTEVVLANKSSFCFLPHPTVPHKDSSFSSHNKIFLLDGCSLIWGEVLTCGRQLNNEMFQFLRYHGKTEIFLNNQLVIKENLLLEPHIKPVSGLGQMEGYTHQASLIVVNKKLNMVECYAATEAFLNSEEKICYGISTLPLDGFIVRLLGYKSEQLYNCLRAIAGIVKNINQSKNESLSIRVPAYAI